MRELPACRVDRGAPPFAAAAHHTSAFKKTRYIPGEATCGEDVGRAGSARSLFVAATDKQREAGQERVSGQDRTVSHPWSLPLPLLLRLLRLLRRSLLPSRRLLPLLLRRGFSEERDLRRLLRLLLDKRGGEQQLRLNNSGQLKPQCYTNLPYGESSKGGGMYLSTTHPVYPACRGNFSPPVRSHFRPPDRPPPVLLGCTVNDESRAPRQHPS